MRNHNEKYKDMVESVLPSTRRRSARHDRRAIHRRHRARVRAALAGGREAADADRRRKREITDFVWDRREADKVGPLVRWAITRIDRDPILRNADVVTQVQAFRRGLPDNLIGRHALSHIEWTLSWRGWGTEFTAAARCARELEHARRRALLLTILETGRHARLNTAIRDRYAREEVADDGSLRRTPFRLLLGLHDVDAFVDDVAHVHGIAALLDELIR